MTEFCSGAFGGGLQHELWCNRIRRPRKIRL